MNLNEWRRLREEGEEAQLPSGLVVRLKRVGVLDLAEQGKVPQTLAPQVEKFLAGQRPTLNDFQAQAEIISLVCRAALLGPEGLDVRELDYQDRLAIFTWANEVNKPLESFRGKQNGVVETPFVSGQL